MSRQTDPHNTDASFDRNVLRHLLATGAEVKRQADRIGRAEADHGIFDLLVLSQLKRLGGCARAGKLVSVIQPTSASVAGALQRLEAAEWVVRTHDDADGRVSTVTLTAAGDAEIDRLWAIYDDWAVDLLAPLTSDERRTLSEILGRLGLSDLPD